MLARTTLRIEQDIYERVKKISIVVHKDIQDIVNEALIAYIPFLQKRAHKASGQGISFGSYSLKYKGGSRKEIYEDR